MCEAACRACERHVRLHAADDLQLFLEHLQTGRRRERSGGHVTTSDIPILGLPVESPQTCWSSLKLEDSAANVPAAGVDVTLWNSSGNTLARHRSPLFGNRRSP